MMRALSGRVEAESAQLLDDFTAMPSTDRLLALAALCEVLLVAPSDGGLARLAPRMSDAALQWIRSGMLAEILFARSEHAYPIAMLIALAARSSNFADEDVDLLSNLVVHRAAAMSELPYLTKDTIATHFAAAGIADLPRLVSSVSLRAMIDKRVLRSRTDEYDMSALMQVAHVASRRGIAMDDRPRLFANVLLLRALRSDDINWIAALALLGRFAFPVETVLLDHARERLESFCAAGDALLPMPHSDLLYPEFFERSDIGLRLRSTIATIALLEERVS